MTLNNFLNLLYYSKDDVVNNRCFKKLAYAIAVKALPDEWNNRRYQNRSS